MEVMRGESPLFSDTLGVGYVSPIEQDSAALAEFYQNVLGIRMVATDTAVFGALTAGWQRGNEASATTA
jgi:hypothetical protein